MPLRSGDIGVVGFRTEAELRRYLGPAGPGREWHHIVEKRLAGRDGFPPELIRSTDNIINLPVEVHRRISARMSMREKAFQTNIRRYRMERLSFAQQYDEGLDLIESSLRQFGYDDWAPGKVIPLFARLLDADLTSIPSPDERLDIRIIAGDWLYKHFGIPGRDRNKLIEPLKRYGIDLPPRLPSIWDRS